MILKQLKKIGAQQNVVADRIGLDKKTVNLICSGKVRLTPKVAMSLERFIYLDARELLIMQVDCDLWNLKQNDQDHPAREKTI